MNQPTENELLVAEIVTAVASEEQCDPLDLPPLYSALGTGPINYGSQDGDWLEFPLSYHGYRVTLDDDGQVSVTPE